MTWSALCLVWGNKVNDDLLPEINGKFPQVPTSTCITDPHHLHCIRAVEDQYHGGGGGKVKYFLYGYVLLLNITFLDNVG